MICAFSKLADVYPCLTRYAGLVLFGVVALTVAASAYSQTIPNCEQSTDPAYDCEQVTAPCDCLAWESRFRGSGGHSIARYLCGVEHSGGITALQRLWLVGLVTKDVTCPPGEQGVTVKDRIGYQWGGPGLTDVGCNNQRLFTPSGGEYPRRIVLTVSVKNEQPCPRFSKSDTFQITGGDVGIDVSCPPEGTLCLDDIEIGPGKLTMAHLKPCDCTPTIPGVPPLAVTWNVVNDHGLKAQGVNWTPMSDNCSAAIYASQEGFAGRVWVVAQIANCTLAQALILGGNGKTNDNEPNKPSCGDCQGADCGGPGKGNVIQGSLDASFSLGRGARGERVGYLRLYADTANAGMVLKSALQANVTPAATVVRDNGVVRQILAPQVLADIRDNATAGYDIAFFSPADVGEFNGVYPIREGALPFVTWHVFGDSTTVQIEKIISSTVVAQYTYVYSDSNHRWNLTSSAPGGVQRVEEKVSSLDGQTGVLTVTTTVKEDSVRVSEVKEYYRTSAGVRGPLFQRDVATGGTSPRTTRYEYHDDPCAPQDCAGKLWRRTGPDGAVTIYRYYPLPDGRLRAEIRNWGDGSLPDNADIDNGHALYYQYTGPAQQHLTTEIQERIEGVTVAKTVTVSDLDAEGYETHVLEQQYPDPALSNCLTTETQYVAGDHNRVQWVKYPDGRRDTCTYTNAWLWLDPGTGDWHLYGTPGQGVPVLCTSVRHTTIDHPNDGIDGKTTIDETYTDAAGEPLLQQTLAHTSTGDVPIAWTLRAYDVTGRVTDEYHSNGTHAHTEWQSCCGNRTVTDEAGIVTDYEYDPVLTRPLMTTKAGDGTHPDFATKYEYANNGSSRTETVTFGFGMADPIVTSRSYDLAGRLVSGTDEAGLVTSYEYSDTAHTVTAHYPGNRTQVTLSYLDGQVRSVTGDVVPQCYQYSTEGNKRLTKVVTGPTIAAPRYAITLRDGVGRVVEERRPAFGGGADLSTTYEYWPTNAHPGAGMLWKTHVPGQTWPTVRVYDELGSVRWTGLDLDGDGLLTESGTDRMSGSETKIELLNQQWWSVTRSYAAMQDGAAPIVVGKRCTRLTGYGPPTDNETVIDETELWNAANVRTATTMRKITRGAKEARAIVSDYETNETEAIVELTVNGLLRSIIGAGTRPGITFGYDDFGRQTLRTETGGRSYVWTRTNYVAGTNRVESVFESTPTNAFNGVATATYEYYDDTNVGAGRVKSVKNADNKYTRYGYDALGNVFHIWGDVPQPAQIWFDSSTGDRTALTTYRGGTGWNDTEFPAEGQGRGAGDTTTWTHDPSTGLVTAKTDARQKSVTYGYDPSTNQLHTRTWARTSAPVTTYGYHPNTAELTSINYGAGGSVSFTYDRAGRLLTVNDTQPNATQHSIDYSGWPASVDETVTFSTSSSRTIHRQYSSWQPGRLTGVSIGTDYAATYEYASEGRLTRVGGPGLPAGAYYGYLPQSNLVSGTWIHDATDANLVYTARHYERYRDMLDWVQNVWRPQANDPSPLPQFNNPRSISLYNYRQNATDFTNMTVPGADLLLRRTQVAYSGVAFGSLRVQTLQSFHYNPRNELSDSTYGSDPPPTWRYEYDNIGNRNTYRHLADPEVTYTSNELNQYEHAALYGTSTGALFPEYDDDGNLTRIGQAGDMNCSGSVGFDDIDAFVLALSDPAGYANTYPGCDRMRADINGDGLVNFDDTQAFSNLLMAPPGPATAYTWDAENRLIAVEPDSTINVVPGTRRAYFGYDFRGRRTYARLEHWTGSAWTVDSERRFVWDGWKLLLELDVTRNDAWQRRFTWGLDLAGLNGQVNSLEGAGTIGGLLAMEEYQATGGNRQYGYFYDAIGNVGQLVDLTTTSLTLPATYRYDPYGNVAAQSGSYADANPWRFSTKWTDQGLGLYYYGYRYYSPGLGRWLSTDRMALPWRGNLYAAVANAPFNWIDPDGAQEVPATQPTNPPAPSMEPPDEPAGQEHGWTYDQYFDWWKSQNPGYSDEQYKRMGRILAKGCVGITMLNLGDTTWPPDLSHCYRGLAQAEKVRAEREKKCPCEGKNQKGEKAKQVIFGVRVFTDKGARVTEERDGRIHFNKPWTFENGRGGKWINFDFGWPTADGKWWHANNAQDPKLPPMETYHDSWPEGYEGFDLTMYCVTCERNEFHPPAKKNAKSKPSPN